MPELPEVECVCRHLKKCIVGKTISNTVIYYEEMIMCDPKYFINNTKGTTILDVYRKGKFIIFKLNNNMYLLTHLRMEGKFFYEPSNSLNSKHIHAYFDLGENFLYYADTRKFGRMYLKKEESLFESEPLLNVGPDPFEIYQSKNYEYVLNKFKNKKKPIKETLLDQSIISGLGNIYVDEVLFRASISPFRPTFKLSEDEIKEIIDISIDVFSKSISLGGTTIKSFTSSRNHIGHYQDYLLVHTKSICPKCQNKITLTRIGGRGTYYCEVCQK